MPNRKYSINVYPPTQWWGFESFVWMRFKAEGAEGLFLPLWMSESRVWALPAAPMSPSGQLLPTDNEISTTPSPRLHQHWVGTEVNDSIASQDTAPGGLLCASVSPLSPPVPGSISQKWGRANQAPCKSAPSLPRSRQLFPKPSSPPPQKCEKIAPSGCCFHPGTGPGAGSQESSACERQTWEPERM